MKAVLRSLPGCSLLFSPLLLLKVHHHDFCDLTDLDHLRPQASIGITARQCHVQQLRATEKRARSSSGFSGKKQLKRSQAYPPQNCLPSIPPPLRSLPASPPGPRHQNSLKSLLSPLSLQTSLPTSPDLLPPKKILPLNSPYCGLLLQPILIPISKGPRALTASTSFPSSPPHDSQLL